MDPATPAGPTLFGALAQGHEKRTLEAETITLVMDNLNTHVPGSLSPCHERPGTEVVRHRSVWTSFSMESSSVTSCL